MKLLPQLFYRFGGINFCDVGVQKSVIHTSCFVGHTLEHEAYPFVNIPVIIDYILIFVASKIKIRLASTHIVWTILGATDDDDLVDFRIVLCIVYLDAVVRIPNSCQIKGLYGDFIDLIYLSCIKIFFINITGLFAGSACYRRTVIAASNLNSCIEDNAQQQRISTGIAQLDKALGGGIMPGLHLVAAMSSLGKTTLVIQMVAEMAKQGQDILFFSLEMSRLDLFAKNISRHTFELNPKKFQTLGQSTNDILNGTANAAENKELKAHFQKAVQAYQQYADKLNVLEGFDGINIDQLVQWTEDYIRLIGRKPVVVIDYIQLLQPTNPKYTDKQNMDYAIKGLKKIAARGVSVFAISSLNRASYDSPVSLGSMKETGNLEYCAETVLAIDFQAMYQALSEKGAKKFDLNVEKSKDRREVVLTILKNRNGPVGDHINMVFYPRYNYFATTMDTYGTPF